MEKIELEPRFIEEGSAKIYEQGHVFYNPVQEVKYTMFNVFKIKLRVSSVQSRYFNLRA